MIQTETITIGSRQFIRTYSDAGMKIERDGIRYDEAVDPIDSGRTYTETDEPVQVFEAENKEQEYLGYLQQLGVDISGT